MLRFARLLILLGPLVPVSAVAGQSALSVDERFHDACVPRDLPAGLPAIRRETTSGDINRKLIELGNYRAMVRRGSATVRAVDLDYQICSAGSHAERSAHESGGGHLDEDDYAARTLLYGLFVKPPGPEDIGRLPALLEWEFAGAYYNTFGELVAEYQQTFNDVPVIGANAQIEFGKYGEVKAFSASPVDLELYQSLVAELGEIGRLKNALPPAPPQGLTVNDPDSAADATLSVFVGRGNEKPTVAWRYQVAQEDRPDDYYDVVIEADEPKILRDAGSISSGDNVIVRTGVGKIVNDTEVYGFPVDCTGDRENCKLAVEDRIGGKDFLVAVWRDATPPEGPDVKSETETFTAPEDTPRAAAIFTYAYLWKLVSHLADKYLADVPASQFPTKIKAIIRDDSEVPGEHKMGVLYFGRMGEDARHGGLDPHIIVHEFVHLMLRAVPNSAIVADQCSGIVGEQFHAAEESLGDILAVLLDTEISGRTVIPTMFGNPSLGDQHRNLKVPNKGSAFIALDIERRVNNGETLAAVLRELKFRQPGAMEEMVRQQCGDRAASRWEKLKYINMGIPNAAMYELLATPQNERPDQMDNAQWYNLWIKSLMSVVYDKKLRCDERDCFDFCDIGLEIVVAAKKHHEDLRPMISDVLRSHGIDPLGDCS